MTIGPIEKGIPCPEPTRKSKYERTNVDRLAILAREMQPGDSRVVTSRKELANLRVRINQAGYSARSRELPQGSGYRIWVKEPLS